MTDSSLIFPSRWLALYVLLAVRCWGAWSAPIADCDETFNYWEPLHFITYGRGLQTWEYSSEFGLRSYLYLGLYFVPLKLLQLLQVEQHFGKVAMFYGLRLVLGVFSYVCERRFLRAVSKVFGNVVHDCLLFFLICNAGMYYASVAFLPQQFTMCVLLLSFSLWMSKNFAWSIFWMGVASLIGWPFSVLCGIPLGVELLWRIVKTRELGFMQVLSWAISSSSSIVVATLLVDYVFYGKWMLAVVNIAVYNSMGTGANLYGVDPWTFYVKNLTLNHSNAFVQAMVLPIVVILATYWWWPGVQSDEKKKRIFSDIFLANNFGNALKYTSPFFVWLAVMWPQPHKEERFIFVVYPVLGLASSITMAIVVAYVSSRFPGRRMLARLILWIMLTCALCGGISRIVGYNQHYGAPHALYEKIETLDVPASFRTDETINVCVGKEWYRFSSHFFLPEATNEQSAFTLRFLKSSFTGQLPQHYAQDIPILEATKLKPVHFNGDNREEISAYTPLDTCHYVVDLDLPDQEEEHFADLGFDLIEHVPFLDANQTPFPYRSYWLPFLDMGTHQQWREYSLFQRHVDNDDDKE